MNRFRTAFCAACVVACLTAASYGASNDQPRKKMIELGWDIPTTEYMAAHWQEMEASAPFDGIMYELIARDDQGKAYSSQALFSPEKWDRALFQKCVDNIKSCKFKKFRDNFIRVNFHPAGFDWADDDAWSAVCEKVGICAWVARQTGDNICFDFESYGAALFKYDAAKGRTFDETRALARRRGREFCSAIVDELPDATIFCLWMNSINYYFGRQKDPDAGLRGADYGLLPAFIDGLLDAATPETRFVEGCENGYYVTQEERYARMSLDALLTTGPGARLVAPENRDKYRLQTTSGFGFYLDMFSNPEGPVHYIGPQTPDETRFDRLRKNLTSAWNSADEYVWIYGEKKRWWAPENGGEWTSWEEALPGITGLINELRAPEEALDDLRAQFDNDSKAESLLKNGDFSRKNAKNAPNDWDFWRHEKSKGEYYVSDGVAAIKGDSNACYLQTIPVEPGKKYFIVGKVGASGHADASLTARWQDGERRWVAVEQDVKIYASLNASVDDRGLREAYGVVVVPQDARFLSLLLSANALDSDSCALFDDARVYRVD